LVRRLLTLLTLASLSLLAALVVAPSASAQDSFCTTSVAAEAENVTECVEAPSPIPSATASADVTVISGGPLTASPTATAIAGGTTTMSSLAAAVGGELPGTGGEGFALVAAALLVGSGVLSYAILRRSG
jgi:hypothetical protein